MPIDEVAQMAADAQAALDAVAAERLPDHPAVRDARSNVQKLAHSLSREAKDPIAIGIVGEYTVGKTMLLGALLGRPGLLPVEERATTGNITALYVRRGEPGQPTHADGSATVHFMSEPELSACVQYMCAHLVPKSKETRFGADVRALQDYDPVTDGWERLEEWSRQALWPVRGAPGSLKQLRKTAAELLAVRNAHLSAPEVLGKETEVSDAVVRVALDLGQGGQVPASYPERDLRPGLTLRDVRYDGADLARAFPLIRRVSYTVQVDPLCWPLETLQGRDSVVLLDFPGLTSARSNHRDQFLSRSELDHVHTILTIYGSAKPGNGIPQSFLTGLQSNSRHAAQLRDYIIAVGNAFDLIPPPQFPHEGPLTLEEVQSASALFRDFTIGALDLTQQRDSRIRVASPIASIVTYGYPRDGLSQQQNARIDEIAHGLPGKQAAWGQIGQRLSAGDPDRPWGPVLTAFADDGGLASLRQLIENHATTHGLANKIAVLRVEREQLRDALTHLELLLPEESGADEATQARLTIEQLCDEFRKQLARITELAHQFRDPLAVSYDGARVIESAREHCVADVMAWPEWHNMILRAKNGRLLRPYVAPKSDAFDSDLDPFANIGDPRSGAESDTTDMFFDRFCTVFTERVAEARHGLRLAVAEWVGQRNQELAPLRARLEHPNVAELLAKGGKRLAATRESADWARGLRVLADMTWAQHNQPKLLAGREITEAQIAAGFPLPRGRVLPWHPKAPEPGDGSDQGHSWHQTYLFRLRCELAAAVADGVAFWLAGDIAEFHAYLMIMLQRGAGFIPAPGQVRGMFPDPSPTGASGRQQEPEGGAAGSPVRALLREWRARDARSGP